MLLISLISCCIGISVATKENPSETYDMLFDVGVRAYNSERWFECKEKFQRALADYYWYEDTVAQCRLQCKSKAKSPIHQEELQDIRFFEKALATSDCIRRCHKKNFPGRPDRIEKETKEKFEDLKPYDFLQFCAHKTDDNELAASAAFTYFVKHQNEKDAKENIKFYQGTPGVTTEAFKNMEIQLFQEFYLKAVDAYSNQDYQQTIKHTEIALTDYYHQFEKCSVLCEEPYDHRSFPDFYNAIADHYISVLKCQQSCTKKLATIFNAEIENYLREHYNYLQYSYHQVGDMGKAVEAVASFLLFKPDDETMLKNKQFYLEQAGITDASFTPRQDAKKHHAVLKERARLMDFVERRYMTAEAAVDDEFNLEDEPDKVYGEKDSTYQEGMDQFRSRHHLTLVLEDEDLHGDDRFLIDGFLAKDDCQQLAGLAEVEKSSDEAAQKSSEITPSRIIQHVKNGSVSEGLAKLLLTVMETSRDYLVRHLNMLQPLYYQFSQLLCGSSENDIWMQQIAADNCEIQDDMTCTKGSASSASRDYSAFMFLTSDGESGKFFFTDKERKVEKEVPSQCGRLLAFRSDAWYGIRKVEKGQVCAVKTWFTLDETHKNSEVAVAQDTLAAMKTKQRFLGNPALHKLLEEDKVEISMAEDDLNGTERFAAMNVLSQEECETLVKLANEGAIAGDGYKNQFGESSSPHTSNEKFEGLTVVRAAQLAAKQEVDLESVKLYLQVSEKTRKLTETYFHLDQPLFFDYTHLVCRKALDDDNKDRTDLSHPVHSDNCHIQPDGSCPRKPPAYAERDYSALLYLNDDFEGGEFFFAHKNLSVQAQVKPKCGMMVSFNAGNYHGVKAVLSGQRCAVALWYTLDSRFNEQAHNVARTIMEKADKPMGPGDHLEL